MRLLPALHRLTGRLSVPSLFNRIFSFRLLDVKSHSGKPSCFPLGHQRLALDDSAGQWPVAAGHGKLARTEGFLDAAASNHVLWEREVHALLVLLVSCGVVSIEELRESVQALPEMQYSGWGYYDKWAAAMASVLLRRAVVSQAELDAALVAEEAGHTERRPEQGKLLQPPKRRALRHMASTIAQSLHDFHEQMSWAERKDSQGSQEPGQRIAAALIDLLSSKGVISLDGLRRAIEVVDSTGARAQGPRLVARAWRDQGFKKRLLSDAGAAAAELGIEAISSTSKTALVAVESTETLHNLVVCTPCSCYPVSILGLAPPWYKSCEYRSRAILQPRSLLQETFGLEVPERSEVRVHNSSASLRYIVLPRQPDGTDTWSEEKLQALVTRDTMIGVAVPRVPLEGFSSL